MAVMLVALVELVRFPFYSWFEPHNYEWHVLTVGVVCFAVAKVVSGGSVRRLRFWIAVVVLVGVSASPLALYGPGLLQRAGTTRQEMTEAILLNTSARATYVTDRRDVAGMLISRGVSVAFFENERELHAIMVSGQQQNKPIVICAPHAVQRLRNSTIGSSSYRLRTKLQVGLCKVVRFRGHIVAVSFSNE